MLLVSEIFSNSVRRSGSAAPGETVTVAVIAGEGVVRVEVTDRAMRIARRTGWLLPPGPGRIGPFEKIKCFYTERTVAAARR
jgi:hypothetical protein